MALSNSIFCDRLSARYAVFVAIVSLMLVLVTGQQVVMAQSGVAYREQVMQAAWTWINEQESTFDPIEYKIKVQEFIATAARVGDENALQKSMQKFRRILNLDEGELLGLVATNAAVCGHWDIAFQNLESQIVSIDSIDCWVSVAQSVGVSQFGPWQRLQELLEAATLSPFNYNHYRFDDEVELTVEDDLLLGVRHEIRFAYVWALINAQRYDQAKTQLAEIGTPFLYNACVMRLQPHIPGLQFREFESSDQQQYFMTCAQTIEWDWLLKSGQPKKVVHAFLEQSDLKTPQQSELFLTSLATLQEQGELDLSADEVQRLVTVLKKALHSPATPAANWQRSIAEHSIVSDVVANNWNDGMLLSDLPLPESKTILRCLFQLEPTTDPISLLKPEDSANYCEQILEQLIKHEQWINVLAFWNHVPLFDKKDQLPERLFKWVGHYGVQGSLREFLANNDTGFNAVTIELLDRKPVAIQERIELLRRKFLQKLALLEDQEDQLKFVIEDAMTFAWRYDVDQFPQMTESLPLEKEYIEWVLKLERFKDATNQIQKFQRSFTKPGAASLAFADRLLSQISQEAENVDDPALANFSRLLELNLRIKAQTDLEKREAVCRQVADEVVALLAQARETSQSLHDRGQFSRDILWFASYYAWMGDEQTTDKILELATQHNKFSLMLNVVENFPPRNPYVAYESSDGFSEPKVFRPRNSFRAGGGVF